MLVALPTEVIGPVKLALVVTDVAVAAFPPMLKFATGVVEVTVNGAVPVPTVDTRVEPVKLPVAVRLVPVATPKTGVTRVGEVKVPVVTVGFVSSLFVKISFPVKVTRVPPAGGSITVPEAAGEASITVVPLTEPATTKLPALPTSPKVFAAVIL